MSDVSKQPAPVPNGSTPIWEWVVADMQARDELGRRKYGTPLQPFNGRDSLQDAYEETLDRAAYLKQAIIERAEEPMRKFWLAQAEWSRATFGSDTERGPIGPLKHLEKEVREAMADPTDVVEFADLLFLVFDASRRAGFSYDQLLEAANAKLVVNKSRQWGKPTSDEPVEHVR